MASREGHLDVVKAYRKGARVNQADNNGETPLHIASLFGYLDVVKLLIVRGANVYRGTYNGGEIPLHMVFTWSFRCS